MKAMKAKPFMITRMFMSIVSAADEAVDKLRDAARRILVQSDEFQRLLRDLK